MDLGLKNKNALITGGSQGIGLAIAKALAVEGCNVAIGARGRERLDQAAAELSKFGVKAVPIVVDFMTEEGCRSFVDSAVAALRLVDEGRTLEAATVRLWPGGDRRSCCSPPLPPA